MRELFTVPERRALIRQYGKHCMALATLQPGLRYIDVPDVGYLAYRSAGKVLRTSFVLGDPICRKSDIGHVIDRALGELRNPVFVQVHKATSQEIIKRGFFRNHFVLVQRNVEFWRAGVSYWKG